MICHNPNFLGLDQKKVLILILLFLLLNMPLYVANSIQPRCFWRKKQNENKNGELESCAFSLEAMELPVEITDFIEPFKEQERNYHNLFALALAFSVDEVNKNFNFLPNASLTFGFLSSGCSFMSQTRKMIETALPYHYNAPNYNCLDITLCSVVLSGPTSEKSLVVGKAMDLYHSQQIVQLTFGPFHHILNDQEQFPYLYQLSPEDTTLALAMITLMLHFSWSWVGLAISDNDYGIQFLSYLRREMEENIVCFAFVNMIPVNRDIYMPRAEVYYNQIMTSYTNVVIIYGDLDSTLGLSFQMWESLGIEKIWVTTSQWDITASKRDSVPDLPHRSLVFSQHHAEISGFKKFLQTLSPLTTNEYLANLDWMNFNCDISASKCKTLRNCSSNASLEWLMVQTFDMAFRDGGYDIYNAVYMVANFYREMLIQPFNINKELQSNCLKIPVTDQDNCLFITYRKTSHMTHQLSIKLSCNNDFLLFSVLKKNYSTNSVGGRMNMNWEKKLQAEYDIFHIWNFPNGLAYKVQIGMFSPYYPHAQQLHVYEDLLEWATGSRELDKELNLVINYGFQLLPLFLYGWRFNDDTFGGYSFEYRGNPL